MATATFQQVSFASGLLSDNIAERVDLPQRFKGLSVCDNAIPIKQGPVIRRPGTKYVAETKSSQAGSITNVRLVDFEFSTDQAYTLEFGDGYIRFYLNRGRLQQDGTTKLVGADADTPFELATPYHEFVGSQGNSSGTHTAGGFVVVNVESFDATEGFVTIDLAAVHAVDVGNIIRIEDTAGPVDEVEGVFPVLTKESTTVITYAKTTGGTAGTVQFNEPDQATHTTSSTHGLSVGQYVTIKNVVPLGYNGTFLIERVPSTTTFVVRTDNGNSALGSITTTATDAVTDLDVGVDKLDWKQSADVLFLTHPNVKPKELQRKSNFSVISGTFSATTGRATLVLSTGNDPHGFQANNPVLGIHSKIIVTGATPAAYNGFFDIETVTENSISYTTLSDPGGALTAGGNVDGWQIVDFDNQDGPYLDENSDDSVALRTIATTQSPSLLKPNVATNLIFSFLDAGRLFRIFRATNDHAWGNITWVETSIVTYYKETDLNSSRQPIGDDVSTVWSLGAWSNALGWPRVIGFVQGRSAFGGNLNQQQTAWISESNNINGFQPKDFETSTVTDDMGINLTIDDDQVNAIHWFASTQQGLLIGTQNSEYLLEGRAQFDPISPSNSVITRQSSIGSAQFIRPVRAGDNSVIFVQTAERKIYQTIFDIDIESNRPQDITQLSEDITISGIKAIALQKEPNPIIWAVLNDGTLIGCSYEVSENVIAWHKHPLGGTDVAVKSITTISDTSGSNPTDQLWMVVERTIDSNTVRYIEYIEDGFETGDDLEDAIYMDSAFTFNGTPTTTITDLEHLEGETVKVLVNGVTETDKTVSSGQITISTAAIPVHVGLGYMSTIATMPIALKQGQPESYQKVKRLNQANVSFLNAQGVQFGLSATDIESVEFSDSTTLQTGVIEKMKLKSSYERSQRLFIVNSSVFPSTVRSIEIDLEVQPIQD